jgi:predicted esterase
MKEIHLAVQKTARYFQFGELDSNTKEVWIVLHGYGHLPAYFSRKFTPLFETRKACFIFPEGMHRFYLEGNSGKVGASWMTRESRETDINDNFHLLEHVIANIHLKTGQPFKLILFGFSQGAATAINWLVRTSQKIDQMVIWAGSVPPEIDYSAHRERLMNSDFKVFLGDKDEFFDKDNENKIFGPLLEAQIPVDIYRFSGGHDLPEEALLNLHNQLIQLKK